MAALPVSPTDPAGLDDAALLRYSRHILLPEIGIEGQARIARARVLVVGAGGLGCPVVLYLAAAGVGELTVADGDAVELPNLQRQIGHDHAHLGENKAVSLARRARAINPTVHVIPLAAMLAGDLLVEAVGAADLVVDASDNFATRHAVNRACVAARRPLVSGAAIGFAGQLAVFDGRADSPCYHCLYPDTGEDGALRCAEAGVFAPLVGVVGALQAAEALKLLAGVGTPLTGRLWLWDARSGDARTLRVPRDPACPVCGGRAEA